MVGFCHVPTKRVWIWWIIIGLQMKLSFPSFFLKIKNTKIEKENHQIADNRLDYKNSKKVLHMFGVTMYVGSRFSSFFKVVFPSFDILTSSSSSSKTSLFIPDDICVTTFAISSVTLISLWSVVLRSVASVTSCHAGSCRRSKRPLNDRAILWTTSRSTRTRNWKSNYL